MLARDLMGTVVPRSGACVEETAQHDWEREMQNLEEKHLLIQDLPQGAVHSLAERTMGVEGVGRRVERRPEGTGYLPMELPYKLQRCRTWE